MLALLQLDATNSALVERLLDEGRLPALAGLRSRGTWTALGRSTPLFAEAGGYVTTYSGVEIEDHGIYAAFQWHAAEQRLRFFDEFPAPAAAWERLSRTGARSLVIDQYESWIPRESEGLRMLNGWQFRHKLTSPFSAPRQANRDLGKRLGRGPSIEFPYGRPSPATLARLTGTFESAASRLADATVAALAEEQFDLVWLTFAGPHQAGHYLGDVLEPSAPASARRALLEDIYVSLDDALERILAELPEDADVIVFAPEGMAANRSRTDLLPGMLAAVLAGKPLEASAPGPGSWIWRLRALAPAELRAAMTRPLPPTVVRGLTLRLHLRGVDWSRTRAFALPGDHSGFIRLNVQGREREGIVDPKDVEALSDEIAHGLASFQDPDGAQTVAAVHRIRQELGAGARVDQLPDLVVEWNAHPSVGQTNATSPRFGTVSRQGDGSSRPGNHTPETWAVIAPGVSRVRTQSRPPQITDLAATACSLLGADMTGLAGEPLLERA
jgi:predicted AlkP superfamily phosphohydrolase/phosphomutase